ncbi:MAG: translocation and assembly module protein TamB, partial [Pseudomonadota bacterium]
MRIAIVTTAVLVGLAAPLAAQDEPGLFGRLFGSSDDADADGGGFIEGLIEDNLSSDVRSVEIQGFDGALSGRATIESLTVADADGVWLTLEEAVLDWNRSALLRGRLEVAELSAARISLPRLQRQGEAEAPTPEATGFALPELPVSVNIEKIEAAEVFLGAELFGAETLASVSGALSLADGEGVADLDISRLNGDGALSLAASYNNASEVLALDLSLEESAGGILATLIGLPGSPSVAFSIAGEAPITAYTADIRLATDGAERLTGRITTEEPEGLPDANLRVTADIRGDIAPVFAPEYRAFFGPDIGLRTRVTTYAEGRTVIDQIALSAEALDLKGEVVVAGGLPKRIAIEGMVGSDSGAPVLLPLSGPETRVDRVDLNVGFDAADGEQWRATFTVAGLDRPGFSARSLDVTGNGTIVAGAVRAVSANLLFGASDLDLGNPDAEEALGERVTGGLALNWADGDPLELTGLRVDGESYQLLANATVAFEEGGPSVNGSAEVRADQLAVFSGLAGRTLGGSAAMETSFTAAPLAGTFDVAATGETIDLIISQPELDRVLAGAATLDLSATRDETGIAIDLRELNSPNAEVSAQAALRSDGSRLSASARLADIALVLPQVPGPAFIDVAARQSEGVWAWNTTSSAAGAELVAEGTARDILGTPVVAASGTLTVVDLGNFAELVALPLSGEIDTVFAAEVVADLSRAQMDITGAFTDVVIGQPQVDTLLAGAVAFDVEAALAESVITLGD